MVAIRVDRAWMDGDEPGLRVLKPQHLKDAGLSKLATGVAGEAR